MALTRADYLEHYRLVLGRFFVANPDLVQRFGEVFTTYVTNGTRGTVADRREACRMLANVLWTGPLGQPYNAHAMKHYFLDQADVPQLPEPL